MTAQNVYKSGLCIGCGLCGSLNQNQIDFDFDKKGFYQPNGGENIDVSAYCPGIKVVLKSEVKNSVERIWGPVTTVKTGFSTNSEIRYKGSSGGGITGFVWYLLSTGYVSGIIHIGNDPINPLLNKSGVSKTLKELTEKCGSRYAPVLSLASITQLLDSTTDTYAFVGKPCDIAGISNFLTLFPQYCSRIKIKVSFFCAGTPSINATKNTLQYLGLSESLKSLKYRGEGWPGFFMAIDDSGKEGKMSYNDSWGKILGRDIHLRCKLCPDGIGMLSDITFADGWEEQDGYPSFEEKPGESLIIARNQLAEGLLSKAVQSGFLKVKDYNISNLKNIQKFQYTRRINVGARIISYFLYTRIFPKYINVFIYRNLAKSSIKEIFQNFLGFFKRINRFNGSA